MKTLIIPVHSFVDVITNSSSEIYVSAGKSTVKAIKELVNNILLIAGSKQTADDLFNIDITFRVDYSENGKYKQEYFTNEEIEAGIEAGKFEEDDVRRTAGEGDYEVSYLRVTPKIDSEEAKNICRTLSDLPGLYDISSEYNG